MGFSLPSGKLIWMLLGSDSSVKSAAQTKLGSQIRAELKAIERGNEV